MRRFFLSLRYARICEKGKFHTWKNAEIFPRAKLLGLPHGKLLTAVSHMENRDDYDEKLPPCGGVFGHTEKKEKNAQRVSGANGKCRAGKQSCSGLTRQIPIQLYVKLQTEK